MDKTTLVIQGIEDGALLIDGFDKFMGVTVAFWADVNHDDDWTLFIASDQITDETRMNAYIEIGRLAKELDIPEVNWEYKIDPVSSEEPIALAAKAAQDVPRRRLRPKGITFPDPRHCGSKSTVDAYIYPALVKTS